MANRDDDGRVRQIAKSELTKAIENALVYYKPISLGGIKLNLIRGKTVAFEVPVENGTTEAGIIDCVRVDEYFGDVSAEMVCCLYSWGTKLWNDCKEFCVKKLTTEKPPRYCDCCGCRFNAISEIGTPKILITCFEIKISEADFKSKNGHNFVGNLNYYVVPYDLYKEINSFVPEEIGIITYSQKRDRLRRQKDSIYQEMSDEKQKWMLLSVMKRLRGRRGD